MNSSLTASDRQSRSRAWRNVASKSGWDKSTAAPPYVFGVPQLPPHVEINPYEILMNRSGLPDGHFAMLTLGVGRFRSIGP